MVRLAGPEACSIAMPMLRLKHDLEPGRAVFGDLIEPGGLDPCGSDIPVRQAADTSAVSRDVPRAVDLRAASGQNPIIENQTFSTPSRTGVSAPPELRPHPQRVDEVVVTYFAKPHSYTTDDIIEISAHGSPVVLRHIVDLALAGGARLAEPGEFTMRAFLNGRIDLTQAEAVRDLIESQTLYQAKIAAQAPRRANPPAHRSNPRASRRTRLLFRLRKNCP